MIDSIAQLIAAIKASTEDQTFQKLTLGKFQNETVKHIYVRLIDLKTGPHLSFVYRYPNQDTTKNTSIPGGIATIAGWLDSSCRSATLLTSKGTQQLAFSRRGSPRLFTQELVTSPLIDRSHDREKLRLLRDERALQ